MDSRERSRVVPDQRARLHHFFHRQVFAFRAESAFRQLFPLRQLFVAVRVRFVLLIEFRMRFHDVLVQLRPRLAHRFPLAGSLGQSRLFALGGFGPVLVQRLSPALVQLDDVPAMGHDFRG